MNQEEAKIKTEIETDIKTEIKEIETEIETETGQEMKEIHQEITETRKTEDQIMNVKEKKGRNQEMTSPSTEMVAIQEKKCCIAKKTERKTRGETKKVEETIGETNGKMTEDLTD